MHTISDFKHGSRFLSANLGKVLTILWVILLAAFYFVALPHKYEGTAPCEFNSWLLLPLNGGKFVVTNEVEVYMESNSPFSFSSVPSSPNEVLEAVLTGYASNGEPVYSFAEPTFIGSGDYMVVAGEVDRAEFRASSPVVVVFVPDSRMLLALTLLTGVIV